MGGQRATHGNSLDSHKGAKGSAAAGGRCHHEPDPCRWLFLQAGGSALPRTWVGAAQVEAGGARGDGCVDVAAPAVLQRQGAAQRKAWRQHEPTAHASPLLQALCSLRISSLASSRAGQPATLPRLAILHPAMAGCPPSCPLQKRSCPALALQK